MDNIIDAQFLFRALITSKLHRSSHRPIDALVTLNKVIWQFSGYGHFATGQVGGVDWGGEILAFFDDFLVTEAELLHAATAATFAILTPIEFETETYF